MNWSNVKEIIWIIQKTESVITHPNPAREGITRQLNNGHQLFFNFINKHPSSIFKF